MKNLKLIPKITSIICAIILMCSNSNATTNINVDVSSGTGYAYLCDGVQYQMTFTGIPSGQSVTNYTWVSENGLTCGTSAVSNVMTLCETKGDESVVVASTSGGGNNWGFTVYFIGAETGISGPNSLCVGNTPTYTISTNETGASSYAWQVPATMSGSCSSCAATHSVTVTSAGVGTLTVTANGCPSGNASNVVVSPSITSYSGVPATPSGLLTFRQTGHSCQFDATIPAVTGATSYIWALNTSFSPILANTSGPTTYPDGDFDYSTTYNIYVKSENACGTSSSYGSWTNRTTPGKPNGCVEAPIKPNTQTTVPADFRFYPNPATNSLSIEYPTTVDNTSIICDMYDMVGHKLASWILPASDNKVTEDISSLQTGAYLYVVHSGENILSRGKLMIRK
jgi:hypothetical protein